MNTRRGFFGRLAALAAGAFTARHVAAAPPAKPAPSLALIGEGRHPETIVPLCDKTIETCRSRFVLPHMECTLPCDLNSKIDPGDLVSIREGDGFAVRADPGDNRPVFGYARRMEWRAGRPHAECTVVMSGRADLGQLVDEHRWLDDAPRMQRWNDTRNEPKGQTVWTGAQVRAEYHRALQLQRTIDDVQRRQVAAGLPPFSDATIERWRRRHARR